MAKNLSKEERELLVWMIVNGIAELVKVGGKIRPVSRI